MKKWKNHMEAASDTHSCMKVILKADRKLRTKIWLAGSNEL